MARQLAGCRVLVVEDLFQVAQLLEDMLQGLGCEVVGPVPRLEQAVELAARERLDAAILDVNLDGRHVGPVAEVLEGRGVPFLFVTGYDRLDELPERFQAMPRLNKPFTIERLAAALGSALDAAC